MTSLQIQMFLSNIVLQLWFTNPQGIFYHPLTSKIDPTTLTKLNSQWRPVNQLCSDRLFGTESLYVMAVGSHLMCLL